MQIQRTSFRVSRYIVDFILIVISFYCAWKFTNLDQLGLLTGKQGMLFTLLVITWYLYGEAIFVYDEFRSRNFSYELIAVIKSVFVQGVLVIVIIFFLKDIELRRIFIFYYVFFLLFVSSISKFLIRRYLNFIRKEGRNLRHLLIVGAGEVGKNFYVTISENAHFGYNVIGFLDDVEKDWLNGKYLGAIDELENILAQNQVDDVIVALPNYASSKLEWVITICEQNTTRVKIIPDYFKFLSEKYEVSTFGPFPVISVRADKLNEFHWRLIKRGFDTGFTIFLFVLVFSWLFPLIALGIKLTSKGPIFFIQERWGRNNKRFRTYKFRSMCTDCNDIDKDGKYQQAKKDDPRITKIGKFLRKTNLDELPQFINVLKGEMSLVGPRPHPTPLNVESKASIRYYMLRHLVKPGITGWAQVNGSRGETETHEKMQKRVNLDLWYIENWTFWIDIQIIFLTIWYMLVGDENAY